MRKRILKLHPAASTTESSGDWLDLTEIATVEVTSEDDRFPVETVFSSGGGPGWRAAQPGPQLIRILFDDPASVRRIQLCFREAEMERTQEFSLRWCPASGGSTEIVRQQWNFSPAGSIAELEDFAVSLEGVSALELTIRPDIGGKDAFATLATWQVSGAPGTSPFR